MLFWLFTLGRCHLMKNLKKERDLAGEEDFRQREELMPRSLKESRAEPGTLMNKGGQWGWRREKRLGEVGDEVWEIIWALRSTLRMSTFTWETWGLTGEFWAEECPALIRVLRGQLWLLCGKYTTSSKSRDWVGDCCQNPDKEWEYLGSRGQDKKCQFVCKF